MNHNNINLQTFNNHNNNYNNYNSYNNYNNNMLNLILNFIKINFLIGYIKIYI